MANLHNILIKLWELDKKLCLFPTDPSMDRLKFVRASMFRKLPAQLAGNGFGQSFTHGLVLNLSLVCFVKS